MALSIGKIFRYVSRPLYRLGPDTLSVKNNGIISNIKSCTLNISRGIHKSNRALATIPLDMPSLSPTMEKGNIVKWHKKEGDKISPGDVLCDIETDKAVIAMDTEEEGILAKIIAPENSKDIPIGTLIALMVEEGDDWQNVEVPAGAASAASSPPPSTSGQPATAPPLTSAPKPKIPNNVLQLDMPSLSPTMEKGNIVKWHKKEGDTIAPGDVLCDIETDKAVIAMDTEEEGILAKIIAPENTKDVPIGTLIALVVEEGGNWEEISKMDIPLSIVSAPAGESSPTTAPTPVAAPVAAKPVVQSAISTPNLVQDSRLVGPSVKKLLQEYNIMSSSVKATGPSGALLKGDVLDHIRKSSLSKVEQKAVGILQTPSAAAPSQPSPQPAASGDYVDIPLSNMRRTIAKRLTESKSFIPHAYASLDSDVGEVARLRKSLAADGIKVSINDFIIKAAALALQRVPQVNAIWVNEGPQLSQSVDISVAVATPNGLITPIVKGASNLSVDQISSTVKELAGKAKEGKLQPHEFQGGSFSISNLGMFGISEFTAVINPPQLAIMAVGTSRTLATENGNVDKMTVTVSYDSRALNEVEMTRFLEEFRHVIQNPNTMLAGTGLDAEAEAFIF